MLRLALYKAAPWKWSYLYNHVIRFWDRGPYSHCELVFSDGVAASASYMDGGVRFATIDFDPAKWDLVDLPGFDERHARLWFKSYEGAKYDLIGQLRFVVSAFETASDRFWCSEACAAALGGPEPWRYTPNGLAAAVRLALAGNTLKNAA